MNTPPLSIRELKPADLPRYGGIPMTFEVKAILMPSPVGGGLGGITLAERPVAEPYVKDYDRFEKPTDWPKHFDLGRWGIFAAERDGALLGGAAVAWDTPGVRMLEEAPDLAVLWDLRVRPDCRGGGIGRALFEHAVAWSRARGCLRLKIETQNNNVGACRFYRSMGCTLGCIKLDAYPDLPGEAMLLWYLDLRGPSAGGYGRDTI